MSAPDIFLSYTREDQQAAQRFAEGFEAHGLSVWWDVTLRSGEAYDQVTEEALRTAKAVVVLWSKRSVVSRWVRAEATLADRNRTLVPARIEACDLPIMFELTQTADLAHWSGKANDPAWRAFLADVRRIIEASAAPQKAPLAVTPPPPALTRPSLAVLPFINRSGCDEDEVFAEGLLDDLTTTLSAIHWVKVVSASATASYRKGARDLGQIGRDLGVRYLLEGNVRRVGEDLRVTAQLVEAEGGGILWTQRFDRSIAELPARLDELVRDVVSLVLRRLERAEGRPVPNFNDPTRPGWEAVVAEEKRAIEIDPSDARAYAALASAQGQLLHYLDDADPRLVQEIVENVRRARALEPDHPAVIGQCAGALIGLGKVREALVLAQRGVALSPGHPGPRFVLGSALARLGRLDEALAELDAAERLAPDSIWAHRALIWRSVTHLQAGRFELALEASEQSLGVVLGPDPFVQTMLCWAKLDRWDRASDVLRQLRDADPDMSRALLERLVRHIYGGSDAVDDYVAMARKVWDEAPGGAEAP
jgi:TolB-like protein